MRVTEEKFPFRGAPRGGAVRRRGRDERRTTRGTDRHEGDACRGPAVLQVTGGPRCSRGRTGEAKDRREGPG